MDNEIKPTWKLAWGLWWRWVLISLGIAVVIGGIVFILFWAGVICTPWDSLLGWVPALW